MKCGHRRSFIIERAPGIYPAVSNVGSKRVAGPAVSGRDDVNMAENTDDLVAFPPFNMACIAVEIFDSETVGLSFFQQSRQTFVNPFAKRLIRPGGLLIENAVDC